MRPFRDQHFLIDQQSVSRIADLLEVSGRRVLEIGPGKGVLTRALLNRGARVCAVEIDDKLSDYLTVTFSSEISSGVLTLIRGDAVKVSLPPFELVVANLPYSISSPVTFRLLDIGFESAVLMYQKEFADRMLASVGSRECGRLSIMIQTYARARRCFNLPPGAFSPPPEVYSSVVWIEPREPLFQIKDRRVYDLIVRELFNHRRKAVSTSLKTLVGIFGEEKIADTIKSLDKSILNSRPEELYLEDFTTISNTISP
jgi:16S rRNA (adenine1518-N6/adenine1519-N6)-dimethyltransferase